MRDIEWGDLRIEEILITRQKAWLVATVDTPCAVKHQPVLYFRGPEHLEPLASDLRINADLVENYGLPLLRRHMILEDLAAI